MSEKKVAITLPTPQSYVPGRLSPNISSDIIRNIPINTRNRLAPLLLRPSPVIPASRSHPQRDDKYFGLNAGTFELR